MLIVTDNAVTEIKNLVAAPEVPDEGGVRIAGNPEGALTLALTGGPAEGDQVVHNNGARVFLEPLVGELLDDKTLDAGIDPEGQVQFTVLEHV